jgi:aspartyl/asparaginyl-tRNA synthetase
MWLEYELLKNPEWNGVYCISTSYRQEKNPIEGRHELIFPMFEFESKGGLKELIRLEAELLEFLGFVKPVEVNYDDVCEEYGGVPILENEHETKMWNEKGSVISLQNFPVRTNPFWNMKDGEGDKYNKVDVILYGQETIGSAERSCDVEKMKEMFYNIEDGDMLTFRVGLSTEDAAMELQVKMEDQDVCINLVGLKQTDTIERVKNKIQDKKDPKP